jgi:hypothetical protein
MADIVKLATDSRGNYKRDLGWKEPTGVKQHRFYLGRDRVQATIRTLRLEQCWGAVEVRWGRQPRESRPPRPVWDAVTLTIAQAVARGDSECPIDPGEHEAQIRREMGAELIHEVMASSFTQEPGLPYPVAILQWWQELQADFPFMPLRQVGDLPREARAKVSAVNADQEVQRRADQQVQRSGSG